MQEIKNILSGYQVKKAESKKVNPRYEKAKLFADRYKINIIMVLKLFKIYGEDRVLGLDSWLRDCGATGNLTGLIIWKLKQEVTH